MARLSRHAIVLIAIVLALPATNHRAMAAEPEPSRSTGLPAPPGQKMRVPDTDGFDPRAVDPGVATAGDILDTGVASWYGGRWSGHRAADGSRFNPEALTAASATLPMGTRVLVTLDGTARSVLVTITDRLGAAERVIDLSRAAARKIGMLGRGTARVVLRQG